MSIISADEAEAFSLAAKDDAAVGEISSVVAASKKVPIRCCRKGGDDRKTERTQLLDEGGSSTEFSEFGQ